MTRTEALVAELEQSMQGACLSGPQAHYELLVPRHPELVNGTAAVLVVLAHRDGEWQLLLNVRSTKLRRHPGEVCFPGGMRELDDRTPTDTALREAYEEIGLPPGAVRIVASLKPYMSRHLIMLYPVLALQTADFTPVTGDEVDKVFYAPLRVFLQETKHTSFMWQETFELHSFDLEATTYGLTAFISVVLAMAVFNEYPEFEMRVIRDRTQPVRTLTALIADKASRIDPAMVPAEQAAASSISKI